MVTLAAHGSTLRIEGAPDLVQSVMAQLPDHYEAASGRADVRLLVEPTDGGVRVVLDDELLLETPDVAEGMRAATSRLEHTVVSLIRDFAVVHTGAVGLPSGVLLVPATSMSGKSTLVRALVRAGAAYFSDEYALLDSDGTCYPYVRPLTMRTATGSERHDPRSLGRVAVGPARVRAVAFLQHDPATRDLDVEELTPGACVLAMLENCVNARLVPAVVLDALTAVANASLSVRGTRGEADAAVSGLVALVAGRGDGRLPMPADEPGHST